MMTLEEAIASLSTKNTSKKEIEDKFLKLKPLMDEARKSEQVQGFVRGLVAMEHPLLAMLDPEQVALDAFIAGIMFGVLMERQEDL